jgi:hypothetical protein
MNEEKGAALLLGCGAGCGSWVLSQVVSPSNWGLVSDSHGGLVHDY